MEYRIEQLARTAGVAVDTIRFYQGKGLLDAPRRDGRVTWYGENHVERLRRIKELQQQGFTLTVIQRFLSGELGKDYAAAVDRTARQAVDLFDRHVRERIQAEGGETEAAERRLLQTFNDLLEASGILVRHHFQRTLLRAAREHIEKTE